MKKITSKKNSRGFTLIEVVLVLAIGGLIFLLAFLAFQNASVNRRDTQRRNDAGKVLAEIANAESDSFTLSDSTLTDFKTAYLGGTDFKGPGSPGAAYTLNWRSGAGTAVTSKTRENIYLGVGQKCAGNNNTTASSGNVAVIVTLEKGWACRDDQ